MGTKTDTAVLARPIVKAACGLNGLVGDEIYFPHVASKKTHYVMVLQTINVLRHPSRYDTLAYA